MIQLQHINDEGKNVGGLYVRAEEIAALWATQAEGHSFSYHIVLRGGKEFQVACVFGDLLDIVNTGSETKI